VTTPRGTARRCSTRSGGDAGRGRQCHPASELYAEQLAGLPPPASTRTHDVLKECNGVNELHRALINCSDLETCCRPQNH
jgi:hypothetical protein